MALPQGFLLLHNTNEPHKQGNGHHCGKGGQTHTGGGGFRIALVEVEEGELIEMINPTIIAFAGEQYEQEGCLSVPDNWVYTKRPMHVTVRAMNRHGEIFEINGSELMARALCHEIDHLDGKLMLDREAPADKIPSEEEQEQRRRARRRSR